MIPTGVVIANEWGGSLQDSLYDLHRSMGAALIPIVILRLIHRWANPPLPLPNDIPAIQRLAAHATHWGLYPADRAAVRRLDRNVSLSSIHHGVQLGQAAADLV
jgi:hypothetical protein